jgi:hypothetical protein
MMKEQAPPGQACLDDSILRGWVRAHKNQLVILTGMNQAKRRAHYSTQMGGAQAGLCAKFTPHLAHGAEACPE